MFRELSNILAEEGSRSIPLAAPETTIVEPVIMGHMPISDFWDVIMKLGWLQAVVCLAFAMIYIVYGWRIFRALVIINVAMIGLFLGRALGVRVDSPGVCGAIGTVLLGSLAWPFMKYCVAVLGAACGMIIGGAIWRAFGLPDEMLWCGAMTGLIAGGFLAFSSFLMSIMLFTCLQGSMFLVMGVLALLNTQANISDSLFQAIHGNTFFLPILLVTPTFCGILFQRWLYKNEENWVMPD